MEITHMIIPEQQASQYDRMNKIYDNYHRLIYSFAYGITQNESLAEQVTIQAFVNLWPIHSLSIKEPRNFSSWLLSNTRTTALEILRGDTIETGSLEAAPDWQEKANDLQHTLLELDEKKRNLLKWFYFEGLSQYSLARRLKIPAGSVQYQLRQAFRSFGPVKMQQQALQTCPMNSKLADYFNLQLEPQETDAFTRHLAACTKCQAELECWKGFTEDFPYLMEPRIPPAALKEQVMKTVFGNEEPDAVPDVPLVSLAEKPSSSKQGNLPKLLGAALAISVCANAYFVSSGMKKAANRKKR